MFIWQNQTQNGLNDPDYRVIILGVVQGMKIKAVRISLKFYYDLFIKIKINIHSEFSVSKFE